MNKCLVSVIVPVFNAQKYLSRCITSLLNQTYTNFELIFINDGSTDNSVEILNEFIEKDSRFQYYSQVNSGPSSARNAGIEISKGEFICFVDADDEVAPNYLELLVKQIMKGYDIVACGYTEISLYGKKRLTDFHNSCQELTKEEFISGILRGVGGTLWGKIYRSQIIRQHMLTLNVDIYKCEDLVFNLTYCLYAENFSAINDYLYSYNRLNESSITAQARLSELPNNDIVINQLNQKLKKLGWDEQQIEDLITQRMISLIIAIASTESQNLNQKGIKYCCSQLEKLLEYPTVKSYFSKYYPRKNLLDNGEYYLKKYALKRSVISFYITYQLRNIKLGVKNICQLIILNLSKRRRNDEKEDTICN